MRSSFWRPHYVQELYHHGVKGQKWGVRRYRNKDGTLTKYGKKKLTKIYNKLDYDLSNSSDHSERDQRIKESGVVDNGDSYLVKKGNTVERWSTNNKETMNGRKYVYTTERDRSAYSEAAVEGLLEAESHHWYLYQLKAKKDIKVAKGKEVVDYILDKYGDEELRTDYKTTAEALKVAPGLDSSWYVRSGKKDKQYVDTLMRGETKTHELIRNTLISNANHRDEVFDHFKKLGYDAMVDAEDDGAFDLPIIVFDSKSSLKLDNVSTGW